MFGTLLLVIVALALREQVLPAGEIPMAEHDRTMDAIATPEGILIEDARFPPIEA